MSISELKKRIKEHENKCSISVACTSVGQQQKNIFLYHNNTRYPAASLIKLFILGAIAEEAAKGKRTLKQKVAISEYVAGSGLLKYLKTPTVFTLKQLAYLMVVYSDNSATNTILSIVTMQQVNKFIKKIEANDTKIVTPMMSTNTETTREYNYTTADDIMLFYNYVFTSFPPSVHEQTALLCRKFLAPSRGSLTSIVKFILSATNAKCVLKIMWHNPAAFIKYIRAALSPLWSKRLTARIPSRRVIAKKSATGKHVFHDTCVMKIKNDFLCTVSMMECPKANFYQRGSAKYKAVLKLTSMVGKTLYKK